MVHPPPRALALLAATIAFILLSPPVASGAVEQPPLTTLMRSESVTLATLQSLTEWIIRADERLEDTRYRLKQIEYQIEENQRKVRALERRNRIRREHLRKRVVSLYKMSRGGIIRILMESPHKHELPARISAATRILRRDSEEMRLYQQELRLLSEHRQRLASDRSNAQALMAQLKAEREKLHATRAEHLQLLDRLKSNHRARRRLGRSQNKNQRALARRINRLTRRLQGAGGFSKLRGELRAPVAGRVVGRFGQVRDKQGIELLRHGLTYSCDPRARVRAVADGVVRLIGPVQGYGKVVLIEHRSNYFTLYGFLARTGVKEGQAVSKGKRIGRAGRDPLTSEPAVYFELRRKERPLNPLAWLR